MNNIDYLDPQVETIWSTPNGDSLLGYMARVSNPDALPDTPADKLISYLIKKKHWSPFEMVNLTVGVNVTRDIARQMLRHGMNKQEFSQRYQDVEKQNTPFVLRECRLQHPTNKQMSVEINPLNLDEEYVADWWEKTQLEIIHLISVRYSEALSKGIAKEQARAILPEGNTMSRLYFNGNIRNWIHFCEVRRDRLTTQKEHCIVADKIWDEITKAFPLTAKAVNDFYFPDFKTD